MSNLKPWSEMTEDEIAKIITTQCKRCSKCQKTKRLLSEHDKKKRPECYVKRGVEDEQGNTLKSN